MTIKSTVLGPGTLVIGEVGTEEQFAAQLTNIRLVPTITTTDPIPVLSGEELDGDDTEVWEMSGTLLQSFDADSLIDWALTNKGAKLPYVFVPNTVADRQYTGIVKVQPVTIGGDVKKRNTSDFTWRCTGAPTPAAAE